jgi:hypothetical protein
MNRKIKALGLALFAVLALTALSASAASAAVEFHSEGSETVLSGSQVAEDVFTTNAGTVRCKNATYSGISNAATTATQTVTPTYSECTAFGFVGATIHTNGCTYTFSAANNTVTIGCAAGKAIEVTTPTCDVKVGAQGPLKGITYTNGGSGTTRDITVDVSIEGLHYEQTGTSFPACTTGTFTNGKYSGSATVTGESTENKHLGIWVQ